ncbi:AAWKG family protein [Streptomyces sp. NPDC001927]
MPDAPKVPPITATDDYWWQAVRLFTGYVPPTRDEIFATLLGNDKIPLMKVEFSDAPEVENSLLGAIDDLQWRSRNSGWHIQDTDFIVPFYSGMYGPITTAPVGENVKMKRARITFIGTIDADVPDGGVYLGGEFKSNLGHAFGGGIDAHHKWNNRNLTTYSFGGGLALARLLELPGQSTVGFSWGEIDVSRKNAVSLKSFEDTAAAFDRAARFFAARNRDLTDWEFDLGKEEFAWKGQAAGIFRDLIHGLQRNYEGYNEQFPQFGTWSKHGYQLRIFGKQLELAVKKLHSAWQIWQEFASNPLRFLYDDLLKVSDEIWYQNLTKVRSGVDPSEHNKVKYEGFSGGYKDYGPLESTATWKRIGEDALKRWQDSVKNDLERVARQVLIDVQNSWNDQRFRPLKSIDIDLEKSFAADVAARDKKRAEDEAAAAKAEADRRQKEAEAAAAARQAEAEARAEERARKAQEEADRKQKEAEARAEAIRLEQERKQEERQRQQEEKQREQEAKQEAKQREQEAKAEAQRAEQERKQEEQQRKQEEKQREQEARQDQQRAEQERKQEEQQAKQEARQQEQEAKQDQQRAEQERKQEEQQAQQQAMVLLQQQKQEERERKQEEKQREQEAKQEQQRAEQERKQEEQEAEQEERQREQEAKQDQLRAEQERKQEEREKQQEAKQREQEAKQEQIRQEQKAEQEQMKEEQKAERARQEARQEEQQRKQEERQREQEAKQDQLRQQQEAKQDEIRAQQEARQGEQQRRQEERQREQEAKQDQLRQEQKSEQGRQEARQDQMRREQEARQDEIRREQEGRQDEYQRRQLEAQERIGDQAASIDLPQSSRYPDSFGDGISAINPDGSVTTQYPDGSSSTIDPRTGESTVTLPDGSRDVSQLAAGESTRNPDGSWTTRQHDGTLVTDFPDGSSTRVDPETGEVTTTFPDGSRANTHLEPGQDFRARPDNPYDASTTGVGTGTGVGSGAGGYEEELYDDPQYNTGDLGARDSLRGQGSTMDDMPRTPMGNPPMLPMGTHMNGATTGGEGTADRVRAVLAHEPETVVRRRQGRGNQNQDDVGAASRNGSATSGSPFMPPMNPPGGQGQQDTQSDRERESWLTEDEDVWGADEDGAPASIGRD